MLCSVSRHFFIEMSKEPKQVQTAAKKSESIKKEMPQITSRPASVDDADLLFSWVNDFKVRKNSFSSDKISYQEHIEWFSKTIADENVSIYIYCFEEQPIGQVRLKYENYSVLISYSVAQKYRGIGLGKQIIHDVEKKISERYPQTRNIIAKVKSDNIASQKIFEDNNYSIVSSEENVIVYNKCIDTETVRSCVSEDINISIARERVLLLTNNRNALKLYDLLSKMGEFVSLYSGILSEEQLTIINPKIVISYNYKYIVPDNIISKVDGKIINLHISYLPWNKGSDPNFWSFIENTPKGVTIHKIDAHLDTGSILFQKEITFDEDTETFRTSYNKLNDEIVSLFCENWQSIVNNSAVPKKQGLGGSYHKRSDLTSFKIKYPFCWDETITEYKRKYNIQ